MQMWLGLIRYSGSPCTSPLFGKRVSAMLCSRQLTKGSSLRLGLSQTFLARHAIWLWIPAASVFATLSA